MNTTTTEEEDSEEYKPCCGCLGILNDTILQIRALGGESIDTSGMCEEAKTVARSFLSVFRRLKNA